MGSARNWLQEERRKTLGDWVAFCLRCGFVQRYFEEFVQELPADCPQCGGELRSECPGCGARYAHDKQCAAERGTTALTIFVS